MRKPRIKRTGEDSYHHIYNHLCVRSDEWPLTDVDKERGMKLLKDLSNYYLIEIISAAWMGNHFHLVCFAPGEAPDLETIAKRHNRFWAKKNKGVPPSLRKPLLDPERDPAACEQAGLDMIDISHFTAVFQQRYTKQYNRVNYRRGTLWAHRFKSTLLEGNQAVWNCVKYVELNPVRAKLVEDPADYRFCTWGWYRGSGKFLFGEEIFIKHLRNVMTWVDTSSWSDDEMLREFNGDLARTMAQEASDQTGRVTSDQTGRVSSEHCPVTSNQTGRGRVDRQEEEERVLEAVAKAKRGDSMPVKFLRRTRHWVDGGIIGSKSFVQEAACEIEDRSRVLRKQLSRGETSAGAMYCFKRLRTALE